MECSTLILDIKRHSDLMIFLQEADQRVVAELVYGVLRGSRYWSFASVQELWKEMSVLFRTIFNNITDETIADWETCLSGVTNKADPNRYTFLSLP
jgi:hypothetical protein